jgi:hypothetical protein
VAQAALCGATCRMKFVQSKLMQCGFEAGERKDYPVWM